MRESIKEAGRATLHLLLGAAVSLLCYLMIGVVLFTGFLTLTVIGAGVLPESVLLLRRLAGWERRRTAARSGAPVPEAYLPLEGPLPERVRTAVADPSTFADLRWLAAQLVYGMVLLYGAMVLWAPALLVDGVWAGLAGRRPVLLPLIGRLADREADWSRTLLTPGPSAARDAALAARIEQLTATRAGAVAAHGAELRRIERDLHDGAQARLVALSMRIGLARRAYASDPATALKLLDDAQDQAEEALAELRHVVRGIHPPILTDRGLTGAVRALAASSGLEVTVTTEALEGTADVPARTAGGPEPEVASGAPEGTHCPLEGTLRGSDRPRRGSERPRRGSEGTHLAPEGTHRAPEGTRRGPAGPPGAAPRAPAAVEAAAYFAVAEALTNAAKHSGATHASVLLARTPTGLRAAVRDEGRGGAEAAEGAGSGLLGLRRRVAALDGTVRLTSPVGGPTVIEVELPCVW
ncbi:sensor histidine kinase [Streptomyces showdoensis]|uniref:histidine kinase n=1 Tax=Streptomyces showdoensis TaxID=68268 RepID=A0A2P2GGC2_STREW|nr:sensor histidine kinase [Streptomyces showdoensis]KKZ70553.1 histidine kinase [Streptomyces showdoensis]